jgi:hypothetical protein
METINITPTKQEHARIIAYVLASHLDGNPSTVVYDGGDYWNFTPYEEDVLFTAWKWLEDISDSLEAIDIDLWQMNKSARVKIIKQALAKAREERNR